MSARRIVCVLLTMLVGTGAAYAIGVNASIGIVSLVTVSSLDDTDCPPSDPRFPWCGEEPPEGGGGYCEHGCSVQYASCSQFCTRMLSICQSFHGSGNPQCLNNLYACQDNCEREDRECRDLPGTCQCDWFNPC